MRSPKAACSIIILALLWAVTAASAQTFKSLYSFGSGTDGIYPESGLVQGFNGALYGTA